MTPTYTLNECSDLGLADLFVQAHQGWLVWVPEAGLWARKGGDGWWPATAEELLWEARTTVERAQRVIFAEADQCGRWTREGKALVKFGLRIGSLATIRRIIALARANPTMHRSLCTFDSRRDVALLAAPKKRRRAG